MHEQRFHWAVKFFDISFFCLEIFTLPRNLGFPPWSQFTRMLLKTSSHFHGHLQIACLRRGKFTLLEKRHIFNGCILQTSLHCVFSHEQQQWFSCGINSNIFTTCLFVCLLVCLFAAQMLDSSLYKSLTPVAPFVFCLYAPFSNGAWFALWRFLKEAKLLKLLFLCSLFKLLRCAFILCCWRTW